MLKYEKGKGWGWTNPNNPESKPIYAGSEEAERVRESGRKRSEGLRDAHYYNPDKDYSGSWDSLFNSAANGGSSFGSWTNHLHHRLRQSKDDDFWSREDPFSGPAYSFKGYNEMKQASGMGYDIMDRNNAMYDMLRKGYSWNQITDITNGKLNPRDAQANYEDFYRDIGYDPSSGQSLEDVVSNAPAWVKEFYQFDMANAAGSANGGGSGGGSGGDSGEDSGGGMLGGPITPGERGERKGVWGGGYSNGGYGNSERPMTSGPLPAGERPSIPTPMPDVFPARERPGTPTLMPDVFPTRERPGNPIPLPRGAPMEDRLWPGREAGMLSSDSEGMRKALVENMEKKLLG